MLLVRFHVIFADHAQFSFAYKTLSLIVDPGDFWRGLALYPGLHALRSGRFRDAFCVAQIIPKPCFLPGPLLV